MTQEGLKATAWPIDTPGEASTLAVMGLKRALIRILGGELPQEQAELELPQSDDARIAALEADVAHVFKMLSKINARAAAQARRDLEADGEEEGGIVDPGATSRDGAAFQPGSPVARMIQKADVARRYRGITNAG